MSELRLATDYTDWRPARARFALSLSLSAAFVGMFLSLVPLPRWDWEPVAEGPVFELDIVQRERGALPAPERIVDESPEEISDDPVQANESAAKKPGDQSTTSTDEITKPVIDWYGEMEKAAKDRSNYADSPSMSTKQDELRRVAKLVYAPVKESGPRPVWENIEKDQLGRTLLRAGDFYRVIDDTSVANQWVFRNFSQYIIYYSPQDVVPDELPFVAHVVERRPYLQD